MKLVLEDSAMCFKLENGSFLFISQKDIQNIYSKIIVEAALSGGLVVGKDSNVIKAEKLHAIMKDQKDLSPEIRDSYHKVIIQLMQTPGATIESPILKEDKL